MGAQDSYSKAADTQCWKRGLFSHFCGLGTLDSALFQSWWLVALLNSCVDILCALLMLTWEQARSIAYFHNPLSDSGLVSESLEMLMSQRCKSLGVLVQDSQFSLGHWFSGNSFGCYTTWVEVWLASFLQCTGFPHIKELSDPKLPSCWGWEILVCNVN